MLLNRLNINLSRQRVSGAAGGVLLLLAAAVACSPEKTTDQDQVQMPPGFTDPLPSGPTSNTWVLSGGTLAVDPPITDAVVVIRDGRLAGWGRRGEVDMPNDSIGYDLRGKWLTPAGEMQLNTLANLLVYNRSPHGKETPAGYVRGKDLSLPTSD